MFIIIGWVVVIVCVIGGYMAMGGKLGPLWQPFELVIIGGAGVGAFICANPKHILGKAGYGFKSVLKGPKYTKEDYLELLSLMYAIFKLAKTKACWRSNRTWKDRRRVRSSKRSRSSPRTTMRLCSCATTSA